MSAGKAEMDALDAEIQSLAVPENANAAMAAEESRCHAVSLTDSVRRAEQHARDESAAARPPPRLSLACHSRFR
jgi:hypothetical protein